jgi:hypothetical protein
VCGLAKLLGARRTFQKPVNMTLRLDAARHEMEHSRRLLSALSLRTPHPLITHRSPRPSSVIAEIIAPLIRIPRTTVGPHIQSTATLESSCYSTGTNFTRQCVRRGGAGGVRCMRRRTTLSCCSVVQEPQLRRLCRTISTNTSNPGVSALPLREGLRLPILFSDSLVRPFSLQPGRHFPNGRRRTAILS